MKRSVILTDRLGPDILSAFWTKGQVLHRERAHLKVPGFSIVLNALLTRKLPTFLSRLNEISGGCEKIAPVYSCFSRYLVPTNSVAPSSVYKAYTTHNSSICSDEGLTLETSAFQSLYGGQFTLSTPLINQIFVFHSPTDAAPQFL